MGASGHRRRGNLTSEIQQVEKRERRVETAHRGLTLEASWEKRADLVKASKYNQTIAQVMGISAKHIHRESTQERDDAQLRDQIIALHKTDPACGHVRISIALGGQQKASTTSDEETRHKATQAQAQAVLYKIHFTSHAHQSHQRQKASKTK